jgi:hypothetical protein
MGVAYGSWRTFAGFSFQRSRILLCLIAAFSSSVLRYLGGGTTVASIIWPPIAR